MHRLPTAFFAVYVQCKRVGFDTFLGKCPCRHFCCRDGLNSDDHDHGSLSWLTRGLEPDSAVCTCD